MEKSFGSTNVSWRPRMLNKDHGNNIVLDNPEKGIFLNVLSRNSWFITSTRPASVRLSACKITPRVLNRF